MAGIIKHTALEGDVWSTLTGHRALFVYAIILTVSIIALMVLFIIKNARDTKAREAEKRRTRNKRRFSRLYDIDEQARKAKKETFENKASLKELCDGFRSYAAGNLGLYYDEDVIRAFVASLSVTRLIIMQGISGTGKTSLSYAFGKYIGHDAVIVPVQPSWKDRSDLLGYYNEFTGNFTETELLCKLYEAGTSDKIFIIVLDEMNIARVEYYFAEFLSVLELPNAESRRIEVTSDIRRNDPLRFEKGRLGIPDNVWFVGTANNDDSTLSISDKVYDRAMVIEFDRRAKPFSAPSVKEEPVSEKYLQSLFELARAGGALSNDMRKKIETLDEYLINRLQITFGNRIMRQTEKFVPVFVACGGTENSAVDLILSKKVLRKLETQNPVYVKSEAEGLLKEIDAIFGEGNMPGCSAYIAGFLRA